MVYGRRVEGRTLELEASGALLDASLVMRDRQTDSWWSIMTSDAIGGPLAGTALPVLPVGEKTTWGAWRSRHPDSLVLSVAGREHVDVDPYAAYFASGDTFRDLPAADDRLPAKEPVFAFHHAGEAWAVPHRAFAGGAVLALPGLPDRILLHREPGAPLFASSEAWLVPAAQAAEREADALLRQVRGGASGFPPLAGVDTFWYTWVGANRDSRLLAGP